MKIAAAADEGRPNLGPQRRSKTLICVIALVLVLLSWAVVIQQVRFERDEAIAAAVRDNINRTVALEQYVVRTLEAADVATLHVRDKYMTDQGYAALAGTPDRPAQLTDPVVTNANFAGVSIVNEKGQLIATSLPNPRRSADLSSHPAFEPHVRQDSGQLFVSVPAYSRILGDTYIWLTRRLNHRDGSFAGVVSVQVTPAQFTNFFQDATFNPSDVISIIGLDGVTRARRTGDILSFGENLSGKLVMRMQFKHPDGTYLGPSGLDGMVRYFSHRRLDDYPLFVTSGVSRAMILASVNERAGSYYAGAALVTLMGIAFAYLLISGINRRARRSLEIAEANQRLREAQRIGQIGDWNRDLATGVTLWSNELCAMYERDPRDDALTWDQFSSYVDEEDAAIILAAHDRALETGETQEYEFNARLPSGAISCRKAVVLPNRDASGKVIELHGTDQDVTAQKRLDTLEGEIAHLSRVDAMNAMAATLAHELNQPLTAATNYLVGSRRILTSGGTVNATLLEEGMRSAEQQVQLAAEIIRRVRDMVSNQSRPYELASVGAIVDDALSLLAVATSFPRMTVRQRLRSNADRVLADKIQIQQVLINLIRNALDAVAEVDKPEVIISSERYDPDFVMLSVSDNGPGIPPEVGDLFSPFASSKAGGLGLGLSISRTIIEAHGGRIWVQQREGGGATISFTIPSPQNAKAPAPRKRARHFAKAD